MVPKMTVEENKLTTPTTTTTTVVVHTEIVPIVASSPLLSPSVNGRVRTPPLPPPPVQLKNDGQPILKKQKAPRKMDSIYSSNSSTKIKNGRRFNMGRTPGMIATNNEVRQRVASAKILRLKQLQNQLTDARQHIAELSAENRLLKSIHKRQDSALAKYENSSAELPQLLSSHAEELRVWQARVKNLKLQNKELQEKIKQKDTVIITLSDQNKHLMQLNKDRNLEERERLTERLKDLEQRLMDKDNDQRMLNRRLQLEMKSFKVQLGQENQKYRDCYGKLERAHAEIARLNNLIESNNLKDSPAMYRAKTSRQHRNRSADDVNRTSGSGMDSSSKSTAKPSPTKYEPAPPRFVNQTKKEQQHTNGHSKPALLTKRKPLKPLTPDTPSADGDIDEESSAPEDLAPLSASLPDNSGRKNVELQDHMKHIEEIEAKLHGQFQGSTSYVPGPPASCIHTVKVEHHTRTIETIGRIQSPESADFEQLLEEEEREIEMLKRQLKDNLIKKENYLDVICDEAMKGSPLKKDNGGGGGQGQAKATMKKKDLDPQKKNKLLAALKAIDGNDSFEK